MLELSSPGSPPHGSLQEQVKGIASPEQVKGAVSPEQPKKQQRKRRR